MTVFSRGTSKIRNSDKTPKSSRYLLAHHRGRLENGGWVHPIISKLDPPPIETANESARIKLLEGAGPGNLLREAVGPIGELLLGDSKQKLR
jgi:hypothetical protein